MALAVFSSREDETNPGRGAMLPPRVSRRSLRLPVAVDRRHLPAIEEGRVGLRLALLIGMLAASYRLLLRLRSRNSRYLPAALALIGATAVLAVTMAGDYSGSFIEFEEVGPLAISIAGIALTLAAFIALQRFLAKRVPARRVRRGECAFCGFPLRGTSHCEGCGRAAIAACSNCGQERRVGTPRCGNCGEP
jgi:hypothetical protein